MKLSRTVKWILVAAVVWMLLPPAVVLAAKWGTLQAQPPMLLVAVSVMAFFPVWISLGSYMALRKLNRRGLTVDPATQRYHEITLLAVAALAIGVQLWLAGTMLGFIEKRPSNLRLIEALSGVFIMVAGNFAAKTSPPKGERAPDPAVWARGMLRIGWCGVVAGFVVLVTAIVAPIDAMPWVIIAVVATYALAAIWQQRNMHRKPA